MLANIARSARSLATLDIFSPMKSVEKFLASLYSPCLKICSTQANNTLMSVRQNSTSVATEFKPTYKKKKVINYGKTAFYIELPPPTNLSTTLECRKCKKLDVKPENSSVVCPYCGVVLEFKSNYDIFQLFNIQYFDVEQPKLKSILKKFRLWKKTYKAESVVEKHTMEHWDLYIEKAYCIVCSAVKRGEYKLNSFGESLPECNDSLDEGFRDEVTARLRDISMCDNVNHLHIMLKQCRNEIQEGVLEAQKAFDVYNIKEAVRHIVRIRYLKERNEAHVIKKLWRLYHEELEKRYA